MRLDEYSKKFIQQALDDYLENTNDINLANLYSAIVESTTEEELPAKALCNWFVELNQLFYLNQYHTDRQFVVDFLKENNLID